MSPEIKKPLAGVAGGTALIFALAGCLPENKNQERADNQRVLCREKFQQNAEWIMENAGQNRYGLYVFEVDGVRCRVPALLPSQD